MYAGARAVRGEGRQVVCFYNLNILAGARTGWDRQMSTQAPTAFRIKAGARYRQIREQIRTQALTAYTVRWGEGRLAVCVHSPSDAGARAERLCRLLL
jgi:hypothetical protein